MYVPGHFALSDEAVLVELMARHDFALLVTTDEAGLPFASHLPILVERRGEGLVLLAHMARANPQWRHFADGAEVLVIFSGPHAYVSPSWYATHPSVPTWNYAAIHAYGRPRLLEHHDTCRALLERLVAVQEAARETPWTMDLPDDYEAAMIRDIVAFEIEVSRLEGKAKLSQNRDETDRRRVAEQLERESSEDARGVARLMRARERAG